MASGFVVGRLAPIGRRALELGLVVLVLVVLATVVLARGVPASGRSVFVVAGPSMEPALQRGSVVIAEPVAPADLRVGDIVSIRVGPQQAIFTHRITRLVPRADGLWLETKGDANESPDPSIVPASTVLGRVTIAIPVAGFLVAALSTPSGVGVLLGVAGVLLALILALGETEQATRRRAGEWVSREVPIRAGESG